MMRSIRVLGLAALAQIAACGSCRRNPPIVHFGEDSATSESPTAEAGAVASGDASPSAIDAGPAVQSNPVTGDGTSLTVDGVAVRSNTGEHFAQFVALDPDGDGDHDVLVARARQDGTIAGLAFYRRDPAGFTGVPIEGGDAPTDPTCNSAHITSRSPHSAVVTYACVTMSGAAGDAALAPPATPASVRAEHLVLALAPTPSLRMRVADLAPALPNTLLDTDVSAIDRDADGRDDVVVTLAARRPTDRPELAARATVVLLDRATGFARDTSEPEASFARLASSVRALATRRRAGDALVATERVVRLRRALCAESGTARIRFGRDVGVACRGSAGLRGVAEALARAYMILGEYPAAIALTRPDTASELGVVGSDRIASDLHRQAPPTPGVTARQGPFIGQALDAAAFARASALALTPAVSPTTVALRGPVTANVEIGSLAVTRGPVGSLADVQARSLDGSRALQGFYETCDGIGVAICPAAALECLGAPARAGELPPQAVLSRLTELPSAEHAASCLREGAVTAPLAHAVDARAVGFGREGLVVAYRGRLYRVGATAAPATPIGGGEPLGGPFPAGSSASESGEYAVVASAEGLFVRDAAGRWHSWAPPELAGRYRQLTDLAISNDGNTVAGLLGGQLWIVQRDPNAVVAPAVR